MGFQWWFFFFFIAIPHFTVLCFSELYRYIFFFLVNFLFSWSIHKCEWGIKVSHYYCVILKHILKHKHILKINPTFSYPPSLILDFSVFFYIFMFILSLWLLLWLLFTKIFFKLDTGLFKWFTFQLWFSFFFRFLFLLYLKTSPYFL